MFFKSGQNIYKEVCIVFLMKGLKLLVCVLFFCVLFTGFVSALDNMNIGNGNGLDEEYKVIMVAEGLRSGKNYHFFNDEATATRICELTSDYVSELFFDKSYPIYVSKQVSNFGSPWGDYLYQWKDGEWIKMGAGLWGDRRSYINYVTCQERACVPQTCNELNIECGDVDDGCGINLSCGECVSGQSCIDGACVANIKCGWADADSDGVITMGDFAFYSTCFQQNVNELEDGLAFCASFDYDEDGRIGNGDFSFFSTCMNRTVGQSTSCILERDCRYDKNCVDGICVEDALENITFCTDSDGGQNTDVKGVATRTNNGINETAEEICGVDVEGVLYTNVLVEFACSDSEIGWYHYNYDCTAGGKICIDGACVEDAVEPCTDDDNCSSGFFCNLSAGVCEATEPDCVSDFVYVFEPLVCPASGFQTKTTVDNNGCVGSEEETVSCVPESCSGCEMEDKCYNFGHRKDGLFCSDDEMEFVSQLEEEEVCQNNFECSSNLCIDGECLESGFLERLLEFLRNVFGFGD